MSPLTAIIFQTYVGFLFFHNPTFLLNKSNFWNQLLSPSPCLKVTNIYRDFTTTHFSSSSMLPKAYIIYVYIQFLSFFSSICLNYCVEVLYKLVSFIDQYLLLGKACHNTAQASPLSPHLTLTQTQSFFFMFFSICVAQTKYVLNLFLQFVKGCILIVGLFLTKV